MNNVDAVSHQVKTAKSAQVSKESTTQRVVVDCHSF